MSKDILYIVGQQQSSSRSIPTSPKTTDLKRAGSHFTLQIAEESTEQIELIEMVLDGFCPAYTNLSQLSNKLRRCCRRSTGSQQTGTGGGRWRGRRRTSQRRGSRWRGCRPPPPASAVRGTCPLTCTTSTAATATRTLSSGMSHHQPRYLYALHLSFWNVKQWLWQSELLQAIYAYTTSIQIASWYSVGLGMCNLNSDYGRQDAPQAVCSAATSRIFRLGLLGVD